MNITKDRVSIIMPSYNQGHFIEDSIKSILRQDYPNIEIIVMDGGSNDNTLSILEKYKDQITFVSQKDNGQSDAVNKGFAAAKGSIIGWLNSDDIYPERCTISRIVKVFYQEQEADLVYGDFIEIDEWNRVVKFHKRSNFSSDRLLRVGFISQPATFFRREVIERIRLREDLTYAMDLDFWLKASQAGMNFQYLPKLVAAERLHRQAKCVKENSAMAQEALSVRQEYGARINWVYKMLRLIDRIYLFSLRLFTVTRIRTYLSNPQHLTIPLDFQGAIRRTLSVGVRTIKPGLYDEL